MGGFILTIQNKRISDLEAKKDYSNSLNVFEERGQGLYKTINRNNFTLYLYNKLNYKVNNYLEFDNGDFIASTGSLFYDTKMGKEAISIIYKDFNSNIDIEKKISGNYSIILYTKKNLYLLRDYFGFYPVYKSIDHRIFSSSFLALSHQMSDLTVSKDELYEYLFSAYFYSNETLFKEIEAIDSSKILQVLPEIKTSPRTIQANHNFKDYNLNKTTEIITESLLDVANTIKINFSNNISSALSGGYDSRLLVAILRNIGIDPYLYVYGNNNDIDVIIARNIANGEKLNMHYDKENEKIQKIDDYFSHYRNMYFFYDGLIEKGIFDNGSDFRTKNIRSQNGRLQINGAGGAIYREIWDYPNKAIKIKDFYTLKYDLSDYSFCTKGFNKSEHYVSFKNKIVEALNINRNFITRYEMEVLLLKLRNNLAIFNHINSQIFSHTFLPFTNPQNVYDSFSLPYKHKLYGRLHSALIKESDPRLASYTSAYGINFSDPVPLKYKAIIQAKQHLPLNIRILLKHYYKRIHEKPANVNYNESVQKLFSGRRLKISDYVDINKIKNNSILSRAYTIELLINKTFLD